VYLRASNKKTFVSLRVYSEAIRRKSAKRENQIAQVLAVLESPGRM